VLATDCGSMNRAKPKSAILSSHRVLSSPLSPPSRPGLAAMSRFCGFKSLCTMFRLCRYLSPDAAGRKEPVMTVQRDGQIERETGPRAS
jgi:hypothetical protein